MNPTSNNFHTTRWTIVLKARVEAPEAKAALSDLCEAYYTPVLRFLQREGKAKDEAEELAQSFFARLLAKNSIQNADPEKGRFRSYLLGALKHFLAEHRRNQSRQKRGGDARHQSIDEPANETSPGLQLADPTSSIPDTYFDQEWALALMDRAFQIIENTLEKNGKYHYFEILKPWLMGDATNLSQAEAATLLNLTPGAIKVSIHRLRKDFSAAIRSEIAQTVNTPEEISEELRYLIEVLSNTQAK